MSDAPKTEPTALPPHPRRLPIGLGLAVLLIVLDQISKSLPLNLYNITQVELTVSMAAEPGKPARQVPVRITHPNSCSLKYDELDLKLRAMLETSGIEPKEPQESPEPAET